MCKYSRPRQKLRKDGNLKESASHVGEKHSRVTTPWSLEQGLGFASFLPGRADDAPPPPVPPLWSLESSGVSRRCSGRRRDSGGTVPALRVRVRALEHRRSRSTRPPWLRALCSLSARRLYRTSRRAPRLPTGAPRAVEIDGGLPGPCDQSDAHPVNIRSFLVHPTMTSFEPPLRNFGPGRTLRERGIVEGPP